MKKIFSPALLIIVLVSILLAGCAQAAATGASPNSSATASVHDQKPAAQTSAATAAPTSQNAPDTKTVDTTPVAQVNSPSVVKISDVLQNHKSLDGKTVIVQGKIVNECGSGCWFTLKEGNAVIYIDLAPNNMVIPQKRGADAKVTAKVVSEGTDVYLIGSKVEF
jgi:hypothetical protein